MSECTAAAHSNIALVKYWGKRDPVLNLPAAGSLSLTLAALTTTTTVRFTSEVERDHLSIDGTPENGSALERLTGWLDIVRQRAGHSKRAIVDSHSNFPTASGLASSASAFAALAVAATRAAGLELDDRTLSALARRGSGSAARSIYGGLVRLHRGTQDDGSDCVAEPIESDWASPTGPLRMVIAVVGGGRKKAHSSRNAMDHCAATSPLYQGWLDSVPADLVAATQAIDAQNLAALGEVAERSALTMHASMWAARPAIMYWQPATLACLDSVRALREGGVAAYATIDAGPHVKVLTTVDHCVAVKAAMAAVAGVTDTIVSGPGGGAVVIT